MLSKGALDRCGERLCHARLERELREPGAVGENADMRYPRAYFQGDRAPDSTFRLNQLIRWLLLTPWNWPSTSPAKARPEARLGLRPAATRLLAAFAFWTNCQARLRLPNEIARYRQLQLDPSVQQAGDLKDKEGQP